MSTAKRLVLSLRGRKESQSTAGTSSTRLVSANSNSPGHELDEIAVVSGSGDSSHLYGSLSQPNGPRYVPGKLCPFISTMRFLKYTFLIHPTGPKFMIPTELFLILFNEYH